MNYNFLISNCVDEEYKGHENSHHFDEWSPHDINTNKLILRQISQSRHLLESTGHVSAATLFMSFQKTFVG